MGKRILYAVLFFTMFSGVNCTDKKIMIKSMPAGPGLKLNWYHYSHISDFSPDYLEITDMGETRGEVIFEASAICRIQVRSDSILILMMGNRILQRVDNNDYHFKILVDTTCRGPYLYK
jgi:hypothetical protein